MLARRLTGVLAGLLTLHLTFVGADVACAQHGIVGAVETHQHATENRDHMVAVLHGDGVGASDQPCDTPTQPECCRAMTSCAVNATSERSLRLPQRPPVRGVIAPAVMRAPLSQITSPDPPPPKA